MNRYIFTRRRRFIIWQTLGALALMGAALALMLAYFDVLIKG
jgi:hypothetical protein